jgi:cyclophilin family peptidyl-prolyl cis-trans isomerase
MAGDNPRVRLTTSTGAITIELCAKEAPITVENFLAYVRAGYYVGTIFHRVIPGFMIQAGGLDASLRDKREGQRPPIRNESANGLRNEAGTVAMARTSSPDSATSQFFVNVRNNDFLNKDRSQDGVGYTVFGRVVDGMDVVRKIEQGRTGSRGGHKDVPTDTVTIVAAEIVPVVTA